MKKILFLIMIFSLVVPSGSFANTEDELIGTWVGSSEFGYGEVSYFVVRLYDDYTALYETNVIRMYEDEGLSMVNNAKWELKEDGVHVYYKNYWDSKKDEEVLLELTQAHYLAYRLATSYVMFVKLPERKQIGSFHTVNNWDD